MRTTTAVLTLAAALALPAAAQAYSDDLDAGFGTSGRAILAVGNQETQVHGSLVHDGKVVIAGAARHNGDTRLYLARFGTTGLPDASFAGTGARMFDLSAGKADQAVAVARQADGRYVVAGYRTVVDAGKDESRAVLVRFNTDGSVDDGTVADSTPGDEYGTDGVITFTPTSGEPASATDVVIDADGKALMVGESEGDRFFQRFSVGGAVSGSAEINAFPYGQYGETKIVRSGSDYFMLDDGPGIGVQKFTSSLQPAAWGSGGSVTFPGTNSGWSANALAVAPDGDIIIAGSTYGSNSLMTARVNANGTIDAAYGGKGTGIASHAIGKMAQYHTGVTVQPNGRIVAAGYADEDRDMVVVTRYLADGTPDTSFGPHGAVITGGRPQDTQGVRDAVPHVDDNGRVLVAGEAADASVTRATVLRFLGGSSARHTGKVMVTPNTTPVAGDTLTCDPGLFAGAPTLQYAWYRASGKLFGTTQTIKVTVSDVSVGLWCTVVATYGNTQHSQVLVSENLLTPGVAPPAPKPTSNGNPAPKAPGQTNTGTTPTSAGVTPQAPGSQTRPVVTSQVRVFPYTVRGLTSKRGRLRLQMRVDTAATMQVRAQKDGAVVLNTRRKLRSGSQVLEFSLNAKGRKLLRSQRRLRLRAQVWVRSAAGLPGRSVTTTVTVTR